MWWRPVRILNEAIELLRNQQATSYHSSVWRNTSSTVENYACYVVTGKEILREGGAADHGVWPLV